MLTGVMNNNNSSISRFHADTKAVTLLVNPKGEETWLEWNSKERAENRTDILRNAHESGKLRSEVFGPFFLAD